jgi:enoyl-[acyl-carrier protein] reductase II
VKCGFYDAIEEAENRGASPEELLDIIGIGKTKVGIFDGDVENGELEIGQVASLLKGNDIEPVAIVMQRLVLEYEQALASLT